MSSKETGPKLGDQAALSRIQVENANSIIPEYFRDSHGLQVMEEIKKWLVDVIPQGYVSQKELLRLPREFQDHDYMFTGSMHSVDFEHMLRDGKVNKLKCMIGEPDPARLVAFEDKGKCAVLVVGFFYDQELRFVRMFEIRNDGKIVRIRDEMPDAYRHTNKPPDWWNKL